MLLFFSSRKIINVLEKCNRQISFVFLAIPSCQISFASTSNLVTHPGPAFVVSSDFNQDGNLDLAVANFDNGTTSILLGDGQGDFTETVLSNGDFAAPNTIALGDVNNDNNIDILVVNNRISTVSIFLGQGDGNFLFQTPISTGSNTTLWGLALGDLNDDGNLDLVVTASR